MQEVTLSGEAANADSTGEGGPRKSVTKSGTNDFHGGAFGRTAIRI